VAIGRNAAIATPQVRLLLMLMLLLVIEGIGFVFPAYPWKS
jgi:hypothetical protein